MQLSKLSIMKKIALSILFFVIGSIILNAQRTDHKWVNEVPSEKLGELIHETYYSKIHQTEIGYSIALPSGYSNEKNANKQYPVIYFLHGGNPGNENRTWYYNFIKSDSLTPMIYVWNNGGKHKSHYDFPQFKSYAESSFIQELIPYIDSTYRTISDRTARGLQGYSMGGRAAARYIFKFPELFSVSVSMAGGHQWEKENSDKKGNNGEYKPNDNSWDLANIYADNPDNPLIKLFVIVGMDDRNYESNVAWSSHLNNLGIHHSLTSVQGANHGDDSKIMKQIGPKTIHYIFYQNFIDAIYKYNK
jgi:enterochelin esterase-like enzyme